MELFQGSTVSRAASDKEKMKELPTYKDNDFLDQNIKLCLPEEAKQQLLAMLAHDTQFLSKLHLMDYSLLLGILIKFSETVNFQAFMIAIELQPRPQIVLPNNIVKNLVTSWLQPLRTLRSRLLVPSQQFLAALISKTSSMRFPVVQVRFSLFV